MSLIFTSYGSLKSLKLKICKIWKILFCIQLRVGLLVHLLMSSSLISYNNGANITPLIIFGCERHSIGKILDRLVDLKKQLACASASFLGRNSKLASLISKIVSVKCGAKKILKCLIGLPRFFYFLMQCTLDNVVHYCYWFLFELFLADCCLLLNWVLFFYTSVTCHNNCLLRTTTWWP